MSATVHRTVPDSPLDDAEVARVVEAALAQAGRPGLCVDVVLVDDPTLAELHARFLDDPSPTDVMAFDLGEDDGGGPAGEIYVSVDCARRVAGERSLEPAAELALYLVHGALHLCGHDDHDDDERQAMRDAERDVLGTLGYRVDSEFHRS